MLANIDVVKNFAVGKNSHNRHLESKGTRLIKYSTCLAQFYANKLYVNITKYSRSTSAVQNLVRDQFKDHKHVIFIKDVPRGSLYLASIV